MLALVLAQIEDFKRAVIPALYFQLPLHANQAFTRRVNGELAQIAGDPFAPEFFRHRRRGAGTAEEIGDEVTFVAGCFDDAFEQGFGFLGGVTKSFITSVCYSGNIKPNRLWSLPILLIKINN